MRTVLSSPPYVAVDFTADKEIRIEYGEQTWLILTVERAIELHTALKSAIIDAQVENRKDLNP